MYGNDELEGSDTISQPSPLDLHGEMAGPTGGLSVFLSRDLGREGVSLPCKHEGKGITEPMLTQWPSLPLTQAVTKNSVSWESAVMWLHV